MREHESETFKRAPRDEEWFKAHVCHFFRRSIIPQRKWDRDTKVSYSTFNFFYSLLQRVDSAYFRGEKASFSFSKRKNKDRSILSIDSLLVVSKKVGSICDMIFRKLVCNHNDDIVKLAATGTDKYYIWRWRYSEKKLIERCIKRPKCLEKDMWNGLATSKQCH